MSISSTAVKKTALTTLNSKYLSGLITSAIYIFVCLICVLCGDLINSMAGRAAAIISVFILTVFLIIPLTLGLVFWSVRLTFCGDSNPLLTFAFFTGKGKYLRALEFAIPFSFRTIVTGAILFIPCFLTDLLANGKLFTLFGAQIPLWSSSLWGVSVTLKVFATAALILVMMKYYLAHFLIAANDNMKPAEAMNLSRIIATRSKKDFIRLMISFTLYIIACVFFIPLIFILPYFTVSYAVHCRYAVAAYNKTADMMNAPETPSFMADISF